MTTNQIRRMFLDFFKSKQHQEVNSASLVPANDDTLLFTNAGMVQFKEVFLGHDKRSYNRATTSQKCVRAGGKHNDLENVGYTARHHTFFEMLGNFSFGDYFKVEAIKFAWEFLTDVLKLPEEKLWITVFEEDMETKEIWLNEIGVDPKRLSLIGAKDNFWAMGDTGPCGPCTEIFYDHGEEVAGGPPGSPDEDGDRYIEIWNLVFMQYNRLSDGTLEDLPNPSVDTGMGLERLAAVLQNVHSNYDIDLFQALLKSAAEIVESYEQNNPSLKVLVDHIRSCAFLICDGILPSNEGRGYVLRRIIRRAVRHGYKLGANETFFYKLVASLIGQMGAAYPELKEKQILIEETLTGEEIQFEKTLNHGMKIFEESVSPLKGHVIPGEVAFKLYDTYGFPVDLTADIARERGLKVDEDGFEACMQEQKARAKSASQFSVDYNQMIKTDEVTTFVGYSLLASDALVKGLYCQGEAVSVLLSGEQGVIILDKTPFYAESGGQVADSGKIEGLGFEFLVKDVQKIGQAVLHVGEVSKGQLKLDDEVTASVAQQLRIQTAANHTATHLLHAALREVIGDHVEQKGSLVDADKLRFDLSNPSPVTPLQLKEVERLVNRVIRQNLLVETIETTPENAQNMGAMALFGEKYGESVRVLKMGDFSIELCGGIHARQTGDLGLFKIVSESGIASGVRRIEALSAEKAMSYTDKQEESLLTVCELLKANTDNVLDKLIKLQTHSKALEKTAQTLKQEIALSVSTQIAEEEIAEITLISALLPNVDMSVLREKIDQYKAQKQKVIVALSTENNGKAQIAVGVSQSVSDKIKAGELVNYIAKQVGGKGGGRPDMAQAGGNEPQNLASAMTSVSQWVKRTTIIESIRDCKSPFKA